ncbi:MAG: Na+/H+ antiporter [Solirubrobacterales bacterium]
MEHLEVFLIGLFVAVAGLSTLARRLSVPYPILLVIGGVVMGGIPGLPAVELDPDLVLVIFLPPLLYYAAFFSSLRDLRADARGISLTSVGLVLVTTCAVAVISHAVIDLPWAMAFALGAIVSPTDPIAATTIMRRVGVPRRVVTVVEGESLVNDAAALIAYRVAVAAAVGGTFSLGEAAIDFVVAAVGGVAIGLAVGWLIAEVRRRLDDPPVEITVSLLTGYAAFVPAEELELSGVLAAVTAGLYIGWLSPEISTARMRIQGFSAWDVLVYLLNATLFLLIGLQLNTILDGLSGFSMWELIGYAVLVSAVVIAARIAWFFTTPYLIRALDRRASQRERRVGPGVRIVVAWSGMRGAVSLAAALALPLQTDAGAALPQRDLILFLTFAVIFATLVLQGLSLPVLIEGLGIADDGADREREELRARLAAAEAALAELEALAEEEWTRPETIERMRGMYDYRLRRFGARAGEAPDDGYEDRSLSYQRAVQSVLGAQHRAVVALRNEGEISDDVMRQIERELDLEEDRLEI